MQHFLLEMTRCVIYIMKYIQRTPPIGAQCKGIKMTKSSDYTKMFQDMFSGKFVGSNSINDMFNNAAEFGAKLNKIAVQTAEKNTEIGSAWMKDTLSKYDRFSESKTEPAEMFKAVSEIISAQAQEAPEQIAKFSEVAKSAQMATAELMMTAGKDLQSEIIKKSKAA